MNLAWTWFHFSTFAWNVKSVNDNFPHFLWFLVKNLPISMWFHVKLLKLCELGVNGNSRHTTEMKREMLKIAFQRKFSVNANSQTQEKSDFCNFLILEPEFATLDKKLFYLPKTTVFIIWKNSKPVCSKSSYQCK